MNVRNGPELLLLQAVDHPLRARTVVHFNIDRGMKMAAIDA